MLHFLNKISTKQQPFLIVGDLECFYEVVPNFSLLPNVTSVFLFSNKDRRIFLKKNKSKGNCSMETNVI